MGLRRGLRTAAATAKSERTPQMTTYFLLLTTYYLLLTTYREEREEAEPAHTGEHLVRVRVRVRVKGER